MEIKGFTVITKKGKLYDKPDAPGYFSTKKKRLQEELYDGKEIVPATLIVEESEEE